MFVRIATFEGGDTDRLRQLTDDDGSRESRRCRKGSAAPWC